jgi:2-polyprenyl-3-methyl-5-hydroxy-6-metoxy-1,4-benzoquinol methylase
VSPDRAFDSRWWEQHYREHGVSDSEPSPYLASEVSTLPVGSALDAGCGDGADAVWLAQHGWEVTAVDVSQTAVAQARERAVAQAPEVSDRLTWVVADLTSWTPPRQYDLVVSHYVHPDQPFAEFVARLAESMSPGGTLLVVGHDDEDEHSRVHAPADASVAAASVTAALNPSRWEIVLAERRSRHVTHDSRSITMHDLVVKAHRREAQ